MYNSPLPMVQTFKNLIGATFPLLLNGRSTTGLNMLGPYGDRDNYVIISPDRRIRYSTELKYPHGNRFHLTEIRSVIDSLIAESTVDVEPSTTAKLSLMASPNPSNGAQTIRFSHPGNQGPSHLEIFDLTGRLVSRPSTTSSADATTAIWNGRATNGALAAPGVYLVRATIGARTLVQRIVRMR